MIKYARWPMLNPCFNQLDNSLTMVAVLIMLFLCVSYSMLLLSIFLLSIL